MQEDAHSRRCTIGLLIACLAGVCLGCEADSAPLAPKQELDGYVLFSPILSAKTYLVDRRGKVVHVWDLESPPAHSVYLLDNGNLLRCAQIPEHAVFPGTYGGHIQEFDWDGELLWEWQIPAEDRLQHHDIEPLPDGNVLLIAWQAKTLRQAVQSGRRRSRVGPAGLWSDCVLEVRPRHPDGGEIVWQWCLWDHLVQDTDPRLDNYVKDVSEHPGRIDVNGDVEPLRMTEAVLERLKALGYASADAAPSDYDPDFLHTNSIAYHPQLDQIVLSVPRFHELWIIDHSTTTEEAAGRIGGRSGRGGDLLYRWGNPRAYGRGEADHQQLFAQHDARWIPQGHPGAGNLLVFNNGSRWPKRPYSSVIEIEPPLESGGRYSIRAGSPYGPQRPAWEYTARRKRSFFAEFISGAHRLVSGNTFVTDGPRGRFFEVTPRGTTVWEFQSPYSGDAPNPHGGLTYSVFRATHIPVDHPALARLP